MLIEQTVMQLYKCDDAVSTVRTLAETRTNEQLAPCLTVQFIQFMRF